MKKSIYVELLKIIKKKSFKVMVCLLIISSCLLTIFVDNPVSNNGVNLVTKDENSDKDYLERYDKYEKEVNNELLKQDYIESGKIKINDKAKNKLAISYTILVFLSIYTIILGSVSFGYEYDKNTIKNMMLDYTSKRNVIFSKIISIFTVVAFLSFLIYITNILSIMIFNHVNLFKLSDILVRNGKIVKKSMLVMHTCEYLKLFFPQIFLIVFSVFLGLLFKSTVFACSVSIFTLLSSTLLTELFIKLKLKFITLTFIPYLDFSIFLNKSNILLYNLENSIDLTIEKGVTILLVSSIIMFLLSKFIFIKRELK